MIRLLYLISLLPFLSCSSSNTQSKITTKDSLNAVISSEESILTYAEGITLLKDSYHKTESPIYTQGDYTFYFNCYKKDSLPVIYEEFLIANNYGYNYKTYYLDNGEIVLYHEKSKQIIPGQNPFIEYKERRFFYRNSIFLKAYERIAESDTLLSETTFNKIEEILVDKNKLYNFSRIENALNCEGDFTLFFDKITTNKLSQKVIVTSNSQGIKSSYLIRRPDSLVINLETMPEVYRGSKLNILYAREGNNMIYKGEKLPN